MKQQPKIKIEGSTRSKKKRQKKKQRQYIRGLKRELKNSTPGSMIKTGLQAFVQGDEFDVDMFNLISTGQNRAQRKKIKKLQKRGINDKDEIFKKLQQTRNKVKKSHDKHIFNDIKQLKNRREKRNKKEAQNKRKFKKQIHH